MDHPQGQNPGPTPGKAPGKAPGQPQPEPAYSGPERRSGGDQRQTVVERRNARTGLERRRGPGRRRTDFVKSAEEGQMTSEQFLFVMAIDAYKRVNAKPFPTWTEVLEVIRKLGYRKTAAMSLDLTAGEDWTEAPDAPAFAPKAEFEGPSKAHIPDEE